MGHIVDNAVDVGPLCFPSVRSKTVIRSDTLLGNHVSCHRLLPSRTDSATTGKKLDAEGVVVWGHIHAFVVDVGPFLRLFRFTPSQQKASLLTSPQKRKNFHICYSPKMFPGKHSVAVKQFKRKSRFRLLRHIPHILVDDGALFPFSPSGTDTATVN